MDPGTIGLLVAEGAALAAISAAYSLGRPQSTTSTAPEPAPEVTTAAPEVTTATPEVTTAAPEVTTAPTEQPSGADPAPVTVNVPPEPEKTLDEIVNEAILKAQSDQYMPDRGTVFQRLNPLAKVNTALANRRSAIETRKQQQGGRKRTFRIRRGGEVTFEKRISSKLYSLKPSDPRPQTAFKTLVTVKEDRVATLLLPVFNAFMWWRFKVQTMPLRYSPVLVADGDSLFQDALKVPEDIHPVFLAANRAFKAEWMKVGKNPFLAETNPFPEPETNPFASEPAPEAVNPFTPEPPSEPVNPFTPEPIAQPAPAAEPEPVVAPVEPAPVEPEPVVEPAPVEPEPVVEPAPVEAVPAQPEPVVEPAPVESAPVETAPVEPAPEPEPVPAEPVPIVPAPILDDQTSRPSTPANAPLDIPLELQLKLNAAREKFESLRMNVETEEKNPSSPFFKSRRKKDRSKAARKAADTRKRNQLLARQDAVIAREALEFKRTQANRSRDERALKRSGIITPIETLLETTETSTNDVAETLEKERPTSASQSWFIDVENELQMYFDYYNQVEADLAVVPSVQSVTVPAAPVVPPPEKTSYGKSSMVGQKIPLRKAKQPPVSFSYSSRTNKRIGGKSRQSTFRRSRKH